VLSEKPTRLAAPIDGDDIMRALGIRPGPAVGRIKERLGELIMDGEIEPSRDAVLAYLQSHRDL
jgi:tRNA nucleotidyltransferase (CCA-adding enzyme)